jgi:predicted ATP-grasp superfamily ATP-dependent carboligase
MTGPNTETYHEYDTVRPAIVLSTDVMGLGVIRALGPMGIPIVAVYYNAGDIGYLSKYVSEKLRASHPERGEEEFVDLLLQSASRFGGGLLIPASDETLTTVSKHKDRLEQCYVVACTDRKTTERFIDKELTYALADRIGVPAPKTTIPKSMEDLERYGRSVRYPCLVKPRQGHRYFELFKEKMVLVDSVDQMAAAYQRAADAGLEVMLQEFIPGDDSEVANYNSYFWDGEPLAEFTAQQIRKAPPELGSPRVVVSKDIPEVIEPGRRILRGMGFYGYSCTEFKRDPRDGVYKLMEVNGRHNRSTLLAVRCGLNFPWIQYKHLVRGELPRQSTYRTGVYWIMLDRDLGYSARYRRKERYRLMEYVRPYLRPHVFDILDLKDARPFMKRCAYLTVSALRAAVSSVWKGRNLSDREVGGIS